MKKKIIALVILGVILLLGVVIQKNIDVVDVNNTRENVLIDEYIPEEEISKEQNRVTIVTLYFVDFATENIVPEARSLDVKELMEEPYKKVIQLLIDGSENDSIGKSIPEGTVLNSVSLNAEELTIDFNENFVSNFETEPEKFLLVVNSVVNTCLEFNDVSSVKFLINGEAYRGLEEAFVKS